MTKTMEIRGVRGFNDILPADSALWRHLEGEAWRIFSTYGFSEIKLPTLEKTELFSRSIGETTDIVEKEMYTFLDRRGDSLTLRPEGTAPVVRAYIEHKLYTAPTTKLYYTGAMFRYERPQKGRYRQFYQIGAEVLGDPSPKADAETMEMLVRYLSSLGIEGASLQINSLGCGKCRPAYRKRLLEFLNTGIKNFCENCKRRVEENPLRALDCKSPGCIEATGDAPDIVESICAPCEEHFNGVKKYLKAFGVTYAVNKRMVRGLDYYTRTTFEITSDALGAQNTIAAGGRYDTLVKDLGGPDTPCFGFALGIERLALVLRESPSHDEEKHIKRIAYVITMGEGTLEKGVALAEKLRESGLGIESDYNTVKIKSSMKCADRLGASYALIIGEDELKDKVVTVKDLKSGEQERLTEDEAVALVSTRKDV